MREANIEPILQFQANYESLAGKVYVAESPDLAAKRAVVITRDADATKVVLAHLDTELQTCLETRLNRAGIHQITLEDSERTLPWQIKDADVGMSAVDFAIVETGTIVEVSSDDTRRLISTLPGIHVAFLRASDLLDKLADAAPRLRKIYRKKSKASNISFISGPSRTADIEMKLFLGVHGPRESHVVICKWD